VRSASGVYKCFPPKGLCCDKKIRLSRDLNCKRPYPPPPSPFSVQSKYSALQSKYSAIQAESQTQIPPHFPHNTRPHVIKNKQMKAVRASHKLPTPNVSTGHRPSAILRQTSSANRTHFSESVFRFWIERYPKKGEIIKIRWNKKISSSVQAD